MTNYAGMSLHCVAFRVAGLALDGSTPSGNAMYVSDKLMKLDFNPDIEAALEVSNRGASGNLIQIYRLPDLMKRLLVTIQIGALDPDLEQILTGGTVLTSPTGITALGVMGTVSKATATTGGLLIPQTYGYKVSALSQFGEGAPSAEATQVVPAGTNTNTVTLTWTAVTAGTNNPVYGYRIYGRTAGGPWLRLADIAATGSPTFTDLGTLTPQAGFAPQATDTSLASPQGYQYPSVGVDPMPNGVSIELWARNIAEPGTPGYPAGQQIGAAPYIRWVLTRVYLRKSNRTIDVNPADSTFEGYAVENSNWGNGPNNDFLYDSSKVAQYSYETSIPTPAIGRVAVPVQV